LLDLRARISKFTKTKGLPGSVVEEGEVRKRESQKIKEEAAYRARSENNATPSVASVNLS